MKFCRPHFAIVVRFFCRALLSRLPVVSTSAGESRLLKGMGYRLKKISVPVIEWRPLVNICLFFDRVALMQSRQAGLELLTLLS